MRRLPARLLSHGRGRSRDFKLYEQTSFRDRIVVTAAAGNGGPGCVSFAAPMPNQRATRRIGPPDGGNGGSGGSIFVATAPQLPNSLAHIGRQIRAGGGTGGSGGHAGGRRGRNVLIEVPVGTTIAELTRPADERAAERERADRRGFWVHYPDSQGRNLDNALFLKLDRRMRQERASTVAPAAEPLSLDLSVPGAAPVLLCQGGRGGLGNPHFCSSELVSPEFASQGEPGQVRSFLFELKIIADVGLIGMPNAGKSTLLNQLSNAKAKVGDWAFTTLSPNIGTIQIEYDSFTVADIPGLVQGAAQNRGLGISFLRHIERAKVLAYVVDISKPDPAADLAILRSELETYLPGSSVRESLVIANKADLLDSSESMQRLQDGLPDDTQVIPISAMRGEGVVRVVHALWTLVKLHR